MCYGVIYKLTNNVNGHIYIGQTVTSIDRRWWYHVRDSKSAKPWTICKAIKKYGPENFTRELVANASTRDELDSLEIKYIRELKPEYNMNRGGRGSGSPTQEVRDKISLASKNRVFTDEHRANISKGLLGREVKQETRDKLSLAFKGIRLRKQPIRPEEITALILRNKNRARKPPKVLTEIDLLMVGMSRNEKISYRAKLDPTRSERMKGEKNPMYGKKRTDKEKADLSKKFSGENNPYYGKKHSDEVKEKMKKAHVNRPHVACPHCSKVGIVSNMKRWHFDNCKEKR